MAPLEEIIPAPMRSFPGIGDTKPIRLCCCVGIVFLCMVFIFQQCKVISSLWELSITFSASAASAGRFLHLLA